MYLKCDAIGARTGARVQSDARLSQPLSHFALMRLFSPHFARPALLHRVLQHTFTPGKFARLSPTRRLLCTQSTTYDIDEDMGKEDKASKNFNLKVPKGTRDCRPLLPQPSYTTR